MSMFGNVIGFFPCKRCSVCKTSRTTRTSSFSSHVTSKVYNSKDFITCQTIMVIYLLRCLCSLQYVGRTMLALNVRIGEHLTNIHKGFIGHSVSKHFHYHHGRNPSLLQVIATEKITTHWRGNNLERHISHRETWWIFDLQSYSPLGLNVEWDINCYIDNYGFL